jgi:hypothetical protein
VPKAQLLEDGPDDVKLSAANPSGTLARLTFRKTGAPSAALTLERNGKVVFDGLLPGQIVLERGEPE